MSKNTLDILLGSRARVKILKCLFRNYPDSFTIGKLSFRIQEPVKVISQEIKILRNIGLIIRR